MGRVVWGITNDAPAGRANGARSTVRAVADTGSGFVRACGTERRSANVNGSSRSVGERWANSGRIQGDGKRDV
jgi:hypothetical protein